MCSRFPVAGVSERPQEFSGPCSRFPERLAQQSNIRSLYSFLPSSTPKVVRSTSMTKSHKSSAGKPSIRKPARWSQILWSCEILTFAFCTSNWLVQMFDFRKCTKLRLILILSLQDLLHNLNLVTTLIDNVEPHCPHHNIGGNHLCDECRKLIVPIVCRRLVSMLWQMVPVFLTDHRTSGRRIRARYKHFNTIWEQINSPLFSNSSFLKNWWSSI